MRPQKRYELIELVVPAGATQNRFNFPDIPQLRSDSTKDIIVRAIEAYTADDIPTDFNNNPVVTAANLKLSSLTLYVGQEESIFRLPLVKLHNVQNSANTQFGTWELNQFEDLSIDWTKSYISTPTAIVPVAQFAYILGIVYQRLKPGTIKKILERRGSFDCD